MSYQLTKIELPRDAWHSLAIEDQYSIALLGHIFNETMVLQRFAHGCHPKVEMASAEKSGAVCQTTFMTRLLLSKIYEAKERIFHSKEIRSFLTSKCFTKMESGYGERLQKDLSSAIADCKWLKDARNTHGMHYPPLSEWHDTLESINRTKDPFTFFLGVAMGDVFFETADQIAEMAYYMQSGNGDWKRGIEIMYKDAINITDKLHIFITECIGAFISSYKESSTPPTLKAKMKLSQKFSTQKIEDLKIPYFFDYSSK
ncbi:hypothetical protein DM44_3201 [Burkholderia cepacia]|jgi:hypothetical protein|nr:hypothetical protein DM42_3403 [Burkholderia cepacia]KGB95746.1 hypothetical protein DM44_3201 [Burkholderia cepacia]